MMAKSMASSPSNAHPRSCASWLPSNDKANNAYHCHLALALSGGFVLAGGKRASNSCSSWRCLFSSFVMPGLHWPVVGLVGEPPTLPKDAPGTFFSHLSYGGDV